jgi:hypothetical protein
MTREEALEAMEKLGINRDDLAEQLGELTGKRYSRPVVSGWLGPKGRGPSEACVVFLKLKMAAAGK